MTAYQRETFLRVRDPDTFPGSFGVEVPLSHDHSTGRDVAALGSRRRVPTDRVTFGSTEPLKEDEESELVARDNLLPQPALTWRDTFLECCSWCAWKNPILWKAGFIEMACSMGFTYISGSLGVTISGYPPWMIGPCIFFANTALVSLFIYALSTSTGAHINPLISIATTFAGLCHPVRCVIYVVCQVAGACIGGAFLRAGIGYERAVAVHNGGCWLDPNGPVTVGQAAANEFIGSFALLMVAFGVGLDPRQKQIYGASLGPFLVGLTVGLCTSATSGLNPNYSGASMFPGRCLGLAAGIGKFYHHDYVWWLPDIAAALFHAIIYSFAPPYTRETVRRPLPRTVDRPMEEEKIANDVLHT